MSKIQEKAEQYAREKLGNWRHIVHSAYEISQCTNGEVSVQDYTAGHNEAKRWIPVSERLPCENGHYLVKVEYSFPKNCKSVIAEFYYKEDGTGYFVSESTECEIIDVIEWSEI